MLPEVRAFVLVLAYILDYIESLIRRIVVFITNYMPVKIIRDDHGRPFLYRYHLFSLTNNGPGVCIHHFIKSDPDRGYHDHPWKHSLSFILCGGYSERIYDKESNDGYTVIHRDRWNINYLKGNGVFHRVMIDEGKDAWTIFFFGTRSKTWGMIGLDGQYRPMSTQVEDGDGGWWNHVVKGLALHKRIKNIGNVVATVDSVIVAEGKVLLIKRGKAPYKDMWAFPGGRIEQTDFDMEFAAKRELFEETNLKDVDLKYYRTIGTNQRDPRGFCMTTIYTAKLDKIPEGVRAGDDAIDYDWFDLNKLPEMAFDHNLIMNETSLRMNL